MKKHDILAINGGVQQSIFELPSEEIAVVTYKSKTDNIVQARCKH